MIGGEVSNDVPSVVGCGSGFNIRGAAFNNSWALSAMLSTESSDGSSSVVTGGAGAP